MAPNKRYLASETKNTDYYDLSQFLLAYPSLYSQHIVQVGRSGSGDLVRRPFHRFPDKGIRFHRMHLALLHLSVHFLG